MGDRRHVILHYRNGKEIYFYTHWGGSELPQTVQNALKREQRWDDESYLARIIFSEMIKDEPNGETGYGIAPFYMESEYDDVEIYFEYQEVRIGSLVSKFSDFINLTFI